MSHPQSPSPHPSVIPTLKYRDARAAIDWLSDAFGFERRLVVPGDGETIVHAQLEVGRGMVMLGSALDDPYARLQTVPESVGGVVTQSIYVVVPDADAHFERARAAHASILMPPRDEPYGGRGYSCHDPEGHLWHFGTYDPFGDPGSDPGSEAHD